MKTRAVLLTLIALLAALAAPMPTRAEEPIKIGAIYAKTGRAAKGNIHALSGVTVAAEEINEYGGLLGRKVELIVFDNQSTEPGSAAAARQAVAAGVVAIVGPAWSSHATAAGKVAQEAKIPIVSSSATNPSVTAIGDFVFRACYVDSFQGDVLARFIRQDLRGDSVVSLVIPDDTYSTGLDEEFSKKFLRMHGMIMDRLTYDPKDKSYDALIKKVKEYDPQYLFIPGHLESAEIAYESQSAGLRAIAVGGDGWDAADFFTGPGAKLRKGYYCTHWSDSVPNFASAGFLTKYHNHPAFNAHMALGFDTMMLVADAIRRAGSDDPVKIRQAIADTTHFQGVTGTISFNKQGDPIKGAVIMKIKNGRPLFQKYIMP